MTTTTTAGRRLCITRGEDAPIVKGRREYFTYRDLGVKAATDGWMRAEITGSVQGLGQPTGWHYHECQGQWVYVLSGWIELAFEDGSQCKLHGGDSVFIPGGFKHNEVDAAQEFEALEISIPAQMTTISCDPPE